VNLLTSLLNIVPAPIAARIRRDGVIAKIARAAVERSASSNVVIAVVRSGPGKSIRLPLDPQHEKYYWAGKHDVPVQESLIETLRPGMVFWDIGAHIGFFTVLGSRAVGSTGRVHSFEPMPSNKARLDQTVRLNGAANVTTHAVAVSGADETAVLHRHAATAMWTLVAERGELDGVAVECRSIDTLALTLGDPDMIKIDVEGAELDLLRGGLATIARVRPTMIVEFAVPHDVGAARKFLPGYDFQQLSDLDWYLSPTDVV
jgi:FkbM family methyltransferase